MFLDYAEINVKAGDGGPGASSFRRESMTPRGGPDGGDGGRGADVILRADAQLTTLMDYRYRQQYKAENGAKGFGSNTFKIELAKRAIVRALKHAAEMEQTS